MIKKILKRYDWMKIGGILAILAIDAAVILLSASLFSTCTNGCKTNSRQDECGSIDLNPVKETMIITEHIIYSKDR